jgi:hypothetical protein
LASIDVCLAFEPDIDNFKQYYMKGNPLLGEANQGYSSAERGSVNLEPRSLYEYEQVQDIVSTLIAFLNPETKEDLLDALFDSLLTYLDYPTNLKQSY